MVTLHRWKQDLFWLNFGPMPSAMLEHMIQVFAQAWYSYRRPMILRGGTAQCCAPP